MAANPTAGGPSGSAAQPAAAAASASSDGGARAPPQQSLISKLNDFLHRDYVTDMAFYGFWLGFWLLMPVPIFWGTLGWALYDLCSIRGYRQPQGRTVLVTGCEGLFGRELVLALAGKGWQVRRCVGSWMRWRWINVDRACA